MGKHTSIHLIRPALLFPGLERFTISGGIRMIVKKARLYLSQGVVLEARLARILRGNFAKSLPNEVKGFIVPETVSGVWV